jgi:hypothetical protein
MFTYNSFGSYDSCSVNIPEVQPNSFMSLTVDQGVVQSFGNISLTVLPSTPIFQTDQLYLDFSNTSFNLSQLFNFASFNKGVIGNKPLTKAG